MRTPSPTVLVVLLATCLVLIIAALARNGSSCPASRTCPDESEPRR